MDTVTLADAKARLSELVERAASGEAVTSLPAAANPSRELRRSRRRANRLTWTDFRL